MALFSSLEQFKAEVEDGDADRVFEQLAQDVLEIAMAGGMPRSWWGTDQRILRACATLNKTPEQAYEWALNS